ncbi:hypothetical protein WH47_05857 [Habropoda laboriosa]|uniref:Uncharacterized protein n=2 Tax=Habropoda laboriosa TaxID=597456 RepID=A0A0L7QTK0_9HYME|nr:hypothetical protein WH47_05857 [Habropoda laboriosa]
MLNCASNGNIKKEQYNFEPPLQLGSVSLETVKSLSVPVMQDWKEENIKTYDPWENTENKSIMRCLIGLSKSQKKQFKLAERKRIYNLQAASIYAWNHKPCFVSHLKRLSLDSIDALLQSIDISKLFISDINEQKTFMKRKCVSDVIEKVTNIVLNMRKSCQKKI